MSGIETHGLKSKQERCILVIDAGYFLTREVVRALQAEGHRSIVVPLRMPTSEALSDPDLFTHFLHNVIAATERERPQALFTINHLGFDAEGRLTELLETLELPGLVWYVDSPRYIFLDHKANVSDNIGIFLWDKSYESWMREIGFDKIETLPLATDPEIFCDAGNGNGERPPLPADGSHLSVGRSDDGDSLIFVGDSMAFAVDKAFSKIPPHLSPKFASGSNALIDELAHRFCETATMNAFNGRTLPWDILEGLLENLPQENNHEFSRPGWSENSPRSHQGMTQQERLNLESALVLMATRLFRNRFVEKVAAAVGSERMVIYGDSDWNRVVNGSARIRPPVDYYRDLPRVYREAGAVLNVTGLQMPFALNQRCYDVPASGGFLLTDAQEALHEQFEPDREIVFFHSEEELLDKWAYYNSNPSQRLQVIERGRRRVLQEHTYRNRIRKLLKVLDQWFNQ